MKVGGCLSRPRIWIGRSRHPFPTQCRPHSRFPTVTAEDHPLGPTQQDEHRTVRLRKDGGKPLPLPPILDPMVLSQRARWEQPKAQPDMNNLTEFQKKLYANPYAHALTAPIRTCSYTQADLPTTHLITLRAIPHPETSKPWMLPTDIAASGRRRSELNLKFLNSQLLFKHLSDIGWKNCAMNPRFDTVMRGSHQTLVWREDLPELVLDLLQKDVEQKLGWHMRWGRFVSCAGRSPDNLDPIDNVSCVLYLGSLKSYADELRYRALKLTRKMDAIVKRFIEKNKTLLSPPQSAGKQHPPRWQKAPWIPQLHARARYPELHFSTVEWRGRQVEIYSLFDLLGEGKMKRLLKDTRFEDARCIVMKEDQSNVAAQLALLQLQAHLAVPGP